MSSHQARPHLLALVFFLSFSFLSFVNCDLAGDRAALLRLRDAVRGRTLLWNTTSPTPCLWQGVTCNTTINRVTALRLPGNGLSGQLPENTLGSLTELRNLSLRSNSLSGPLPSDIGLCTELLYIYLQDNRFSRDIPNGFFVLSNLLRVNLASNSFSGQRLSEFNNLTQLRTLSLENNQFTGSLPQLNSLSELREFNVSFNNLTGPILGRLNQFPSQSFLGNSLCGGPLASCPTLDPNPNGGSNLSGGAIAGIVIGSVFGLVLILLVVFILWRKYRSGTFSRQHETSRSPMKPQEYDFRRPRPFKGNKNHESNKGNGNVGLVFFGDSAQEFKLEQLLRSSAEVLGKGIIGTTYKAYLATGDEVVVKRLRTVCVPEEEFREKIEALGSFTHENLVPLRAYFYCKDEKLVVFESMAMGSLYSALHGGNRTILTWVVRSRIALGVAKGVEYLHCLGANVSHGNIKSSNILLTQHYDACLSEYCITKLVSSISTSKNDYRAPEVVDSRKVSQKADVYSFGVLLLELLTGKAPKSALDGKGIDLPRWVHSVAQEELTIEVFDPELLKYQNFEEQMVQLLHLAISCTSHHPDKRPFMEEVTGRIKKICGESASQ